MTRPRPALQRPAPNQTRSRRGFTLIELLVVISIIAVLISLIAPAVQNARRAARRMQCLSNMHNLAIATHNFASTSGALPPLSSSMKVGTIGTASPTGQLTYVCSWVVPLLPVMDQAALYKSLRQGMVYSGVSDNPMTPNVDYAMPTDGTTGLDNQTLNIPVLTCPEDNNNLGRGGGLSYAANAGYISNALWGSSSESQRYPANQTLPSHNLYQIDYNLDGNYGATSTPPNNAYDATVAAATGVFWRVATPSDPKVTIDSISNSDGVSNTIMFGENVNSADWTSPATNTCAIGVAVDPAAPFGKMTYVPTTALWPVPTGTFSQATATVNGSSLTFTTDQINNLLLSAPTAQGIPRPSSNHLGVVNFVLCDGSARSINENIDASVYVRLLTPDGRTYGQPLVNGSDF